MSVLITGITGFAGSHLAEYLLAQGGKIWGTYLLEDFENVTSFQTKLKLVRCDITDLAQIREVLSQCRPRFIYHLAGFSSVGRSFADPLLSFRQNIIGTQNLLESVRQLSLKPKTLIVSSAEIYGQVPKESQPIKENQPLQPISPYGVSKAISDLLSHQYFLHYQLPVIRVRAFNHIGPRQSAGFVIPDFLSQVARIHLGLQEPTLRVGNLQVKRDFTDVRDMVRGYHLLLQKGKPGEIYHLSSSKAYSLKEVLRIILRFTPIKIKISANPTWRPTDIPLLIGNSSKARRLTGWRPTIALEKSLEDAFGYWLSQLIPK
jgi:GDP-4-dehydro-6-deoxy-D-mannose reductase